HPLLDGVYVLARLGEDVRVLGRGEDAVEGRLEEAPAGAQQSPCRLWGRNRHLIGGDPHHGAILPVQCDVVQVCVPGRRRQKLPEPTEGGQEGAWILTQRRGVPSIQGPEHQATDQEDGPMFGDEGESRSYEAVGTRSSRVKLDHTHSRYGVL